jgi:hypothetical protein
MFLGVTSLGEVGVMREAGPRSLLYEDESCATQEMNFSGMYMGLAKLEHLKRVTMSYQSLPLGRCKSTLPAGNGNS